MVALRPKQASQRRLRFRTRKTTSEHNDRFHTPGNRRHGIGGESVDGEEVVRFRDVLLEDYEGGGWD